MKLAYRLKHALERLARHRNHLTFLLRCKENGITPDGLRVSLPLSSWGTQRIAKRTVAALLRLLIRDIRTKKVRITEEANACSEKIRALVDVDKWEMLESWCASAAETSYTETKSRQIQKFSCLLARHETRRLPTEQIVCNLSSKTLTPKEEEVLALGLNFVTTPRQIPIIKMIASTEATARQLNEESAQHLRSKVSAILHTAKPPKSNLSPGLQSAMRKLQKDKDIVIIPDDKGNATVVMDRSEYTRKMDDLLRDEAYEKLRKDPTSQIETKVFQALKKLEEKGYISNSQRLYLAPRHSTPPQIYGLPKVHKDRNPLRPIVAAIGSPTHPLAKKLASILAPLAGNTTSHVRNSVDFVEHIQQTPLEEDNCLVSFDVVSLFTKVPLDEALQVIA